MKRDQSVQDRILVINSGSSSIKYQLLVLPGERVVAHGVVENIGGAHSRHIDYTAGKQQPPRIRAIPIANHQQALSLISEFLADTVGRRQDRFLTAIGHRVVHGGESFIAPTLLEPSVVAAIDRLSVLAPLHNPANVQGMRVCLALFPEVPQVAVFDTAFHRTLPDYAYRYAVPRAWYRDYGIRRYGFHGTSHRFVAQAAAAVIKRPLAELNLITLHLGNGASVSAIENGECIDTSMGFTPAEGLIMGSRCGDIDATIPLYMQRAGGLNASEVDEVLNRQAGLTGLAGTNDVRGLLKRETQGDRDAALALAAYVYRIRKYIGAYAAALGRVDALVFTGGVGENSAQIRSRCCRKLQLLGIVLDETRNNRTVDSVARINVTEQPVQVLVIRTNEELQIAGEVRTLLNAQGRSHPDQQFTKNG